MWTQISKYKWRVELERTVRMMLTSMIKYLNLKGIHQQIFKKIKIKGMITVANQSLTTTNFLLLKATLHKMNQSIRNTKISPKLKTKMIILKTKMQMRKKTRSIKSSFCKLYLKPLTKLSSNYTLELETHWPKWN